MTPLIIGGVCVTCLLGAIMFALLIIGGITLYKFRSKGGRLYDGVSSDEFKILKEAMEETLKTEAARQALLKIQNATTQALAKKNPQ